MKYSKKRRSSGMKKRSTNGRKNKRKSFDSYRISRGGIRL